jgi:Protein of unknown function (DUF4231)
LGEVAQKTEMSAAEYLAGRVEEQIKFYDDGGSRLKRLFFWMRAGELGMAGSIPVLVRFVSDAQPSYATAIALLGAGATFIGGLVALGKFHERWIEYRFTCEQLKHEKYLYMREAQPYHEENRHTLFAERIEDLVSAEYSKWRESIKQTGGTK